ncbi:hypothetical protein BN14_00157 [Rhizoctonia solani AG-1 IB]|uniref:Uncharacterized protein n=1 Tax=Thanatephorus cucumeris (strain AG1-IB / isolate 7/3/14) TaxID=1108050 RepID=M5BJJ1_THACB|nr:hypothetical protein BN14_00157 [Rhizoctonia solani AG-1 IB]
MASGESQGHLTAERSRRKSVPHQAVEVVTIDYIRPDWEAKLEAVRATVARRANRRIVMRQVGDRLIPVGITSGRVVPVNIGEGDASGSGRRGRRSRPGGSSELPIPDLEEVQFLYFQSHGLPTYHELNQLMMMEAMRLSLLEHEAQQRREREATARSTDSNSGAEASRETANASPDPASGLQQPDHEQHQPSHTSSSLSVTSAGLAASSGSNTPLQPNSSGALEPASNQSPATLPHDLSDTSQTGSLSHRRIGSGPLQVTPSLSSATNLAIAVGFPSVSDSSETGDARTEQSGFPPRTLNAISAAVSASSIPAAILGSGSNDHPEHGPGTPNHEVGQFVVGHSSLGEPQDQGVSDERISSDSSPPAHQERGTTIMSPGSVSTSRPSSPSGGSPSNSTNDTNVSVPPPAFLSADARTITEASVRTTDTQQSKGDSYSILPSSPETEIKQPLMTGPPSLTRFDTEDSYQAQGSSSTAQ